MPRCIKQSEFDPALHVKISGPHTLEECQQICGDTGGLTSSSVQKQSGCGCQKRTEMFEVVEPVNG